MTSPVPKCKSYVIRPASRQHRHGVKYIAMFLLVRNSVFPLVRNPLIWLVHLLIQFFIRVPTVCSKVEKGCLLFFNDRGSAKNTTLCETLTDYPWFHLPGRDIRIHVCKNVTGLQIFVYLSLCLFISLMFMSIKWPLPFRCHFKVRLFRYWLGWRHGHLRRGKNKNTNVNNRSSIK